MKHTLRINLIALGGCGGTVLQGLNKDRSFNVVKTIPLSIDIPMSYPSEVQVIQFEIGNFADGGCEASPEIPINWQSHPQCNLFDFIRRLDPHRDIVVFSSGLGMGVFTRVGVFAARHATSMGLPTIVFAPYAFAFISELQRRRIEQEILELLKSHVPVIALSNQRILYKLGCAANLQDVFSVYQTLLKDTLFAFQVMITACGPINIDFSHLRALLKWGGYTAVGLGRSKGKNGVEAAICGALHPPFLREFAPGPAKALLLKLTVGSTFPIEYLEKVQRLISDIVGNGTETIVGLDIQPVMTNSVTAVAIKTGMKLKVR